MNNANRLTAWMVVAGSIAVGLLACSADSLWIDEAWMALLASKGTLAGWWGGMKETSGSTLQMPLYAFYLWSWEKIAGHAEWMLRAANIPFFVLGQWALFRALRPKLRLAAWTAVIAAVNPFVWNYLDETRPYSMQFGGACLVVAGLVQLTERRAFATRDVALFCAGLLILCGSSALAFPWAGMALLIALFLTYKERALVRLRPHNILLAGGTSLFLLAIFAYDVWAAQSGGKASSVGTTGIFNVLFVGYEMLGFVGLGPGRLQMRESQSLSVLIPYLLPLSALTVTLLIAFLHLRRIERSLVLTFLLYAFIPLIFITLLAYAAPFRLLARHVTPLAPVVIVTLAFAASSGARWGVNRWFIPLWFVSALMLRFQPSHHRDDYRAAAEEAKSALAQGETVWWSADAAGAAYYQLPVAKSPKGSGALLLIGPSIADIKNFAAPEMVVASKPDIFDPRHAISTFVTDNGYIVDRRLPAFTIWRKAADPSPVR